MARYFPNQVYDLDNLVTLCEDCHDAFHYIFKGGSRIKCVKKDYERFKELKKFILKSEWGRR